MMADVQLILDPVSSKYEYIRELRGVTTQLSVLLLVLHMLSMCVYTEWYMATRHDGLAYLCCVIHQRSRADFRMLEWCALWMHGVGGQSVTG